MTSYDPKTEPEKNERNHDTWLGEMEAEAAAKFATQSPIARETIEITKDPRTKNDKTGHAQTKEDKL